MTTTVVLMSGGERDWHGNRRGRGAPSSLLYRANETLVAKLEMLVSNGNHGSRSRELEYRADIEVGANLRFGRHLLLRARRRASSLQGRC